MRRWHPLSRLFRAADPHDGSRCILVLEELEGREVPAPLVTAAFATPPEFNEGTVFTFRDPMVDPAGGTFFVSDASYFFSESDYTAVLTTGNGTILVDEAAAADRGVTVADNGTSSVTLTGLLDFSLDGIPAGINGVLVSGLITLTPSTAYYSGDAPVTLTVTDPGGETGSAGVSLHVLPVVQAPGVFVDSFGEMRAPASGFVFTPGFVPVSPWPDQDGSEGVTFLISVGAENAEGFTLLAGGSALTPVEPGQWRISDTNPTALRAVLDSLVLVPPPDFSGRAFLSISGSIRDEASYADDSTAVVEQFYLSQFARLRFFQGATISAPPVFALEGQGVDLGGRFSATDPDFLEGDSYTLTLTVPSGTLLFNADAVPEGLSAGRDVAPDGSTTVLLSGSLDAINQFLATAGSLTYTPDGAFFSGVVPLTLTLTNYPGDPYSGYPEGQGGTAAADLPGEVPAPVTVVAPLSFIPVAGHVFPAASDAVTDQDTPVAISISLSALADTDGSESVLVIVEGVPSGATFNHGTALGGGQWAFSPGDLVGLVFTPPPGASGAFAFTVKAIVTDSAPGLPSDSATESTTFTVTVIPAPVVPEPPPVVPPPVVPPPVVKLPPATTFAFGAPTATVAAVAVSEVGTTTDTADDARPEVRPASAEFIDGGALALTTQQALAGTEDRASLAPPSPGSFFPQPEASQPAYGGGDRHPLPPVLPLDQTLPVAGFTDSGGDSLALVDRIYRDAKAGPPQTGVSRIEILEIPVPAGWVGPAAEPQQVAAQQAEPDTPLGFFTPRGADQGDVPPAEAGANESDWRPWAAAAVAAGAVATWAWATRGPEAVAAWLTRRFLRALPRRTTERTA